MRVCDLIDRSKAVLRPSGVALHRHVGVTDSAVAQWRNGRSPLPDRGAVRLCRLLGLAPALVLPQLHADRATDPDVARAWNECVDAVRRGGVTDAQNVYSVPVPFGRDGRLRRVA